MTKAEHIQDVLRFFASKGRKAQRGKGESPRPLSRPAPFHKGAYMVRSDLVLDGLPC